MTMTAILSTQSLEAIPLMGDTNSSWVT
jgi:hypothetical protein